MFWHHDNATRTLLIALCAGAAGGPALAQDGRPAPEPSEQTVLVAQNDERPGPAQAQRVTPGVANGNSRRPDSGEMVTLGLSQVTVEDLLPFIGETTGKAILPSSTTAITALMQKKITVMRDEPVTRMQALDLILTALKNNGVGVVEYDDKIILALSTEVTQIMPAVLGPDDTVLRRTDLGNQITKIYRIENTDATMLSEHIEAVVPDETTVLVDSNSNTITVKSTVEVCQHVQRVINALDHRFIKARTETFRLAHADANEIANNIYELFEDTGTTTAGGGAGSRSTPRTRLTAQQRQRMRDAAQRSGTGGTPAATSTPGPTVELRVTVNTSQNSVTVQADPAVVELIGELIASEWDLPRPKTTKKVYYLKYTDPVKMRDMLHELLGEGGGGVGTAGRRTAGAPGGAGGRGDVAEAIGGIYRIEAYEDSNSLVVICKTEEAFTFLDSLIADLDQPIFPGLPMVVELKHADAEEVADQVNVILAPPGARVDMLRRETGLQGIDIGGPAADGEGGATGQPSGTSGQAAGTMSFPWQQSRPGEEGSVTESALIGKVRVVPIHRQNAVMILAAPEYRESVRELIVNQLDRPGRQVMISAILAEVEWNDELALGVRFSNSDSILGGPLVDNRIGGTGSFQGTRESDGLFGFLDSSVLDVNVSLNVVLQALHQKTKVRILQQPVVFTADNQEASFFEGQDVPVLSQTQTTSEGTVNESVNYESVGIGLNVRPRITTEGDVDLEINLEVSNIVPGQGQFNSPVFDRRETTTQVIIKDQQTIVLSGILRELESRIERKIPLLGDIPLLGEVFKSRENTTTTTELLMFIQPTVVNDPSENDFNYNADAVEYLDEHLSRPLKEQKPRGVAPGRRRELLEQPYQDDFRRPPPSEP
ncbi:MAG: secretin N-terminal domain-containing protein [Planctomycetota bacterium]|jgi:type II secretory pathway component GspD/PulD (secretin)